MDSPNLERQKAEFQIRKKHLCYAAVAFVILVPLPLALIGQVTIAGILCILTAIFVGVHPEFTNEPTAAVHDLLRAAGKKPLPPQPMPVNQGREGSAVTDQSANNSGVSSRFTRDTRR